MGSNNHILSYSSLPPSPSHSFPFLSLRFSYKKMNVSCIFLRRILNVFIVIIIIITILIIIILWYFFTFLLELRFIFFPSLPFMIHFWFTSPLTCSFIDDSPIITMLIILSLFPSCYMFYAIYILPFLTLSFPPLDFLAFSYIQKHRSFSVWYICKTVTRRKNGHSY